jgi:transcriptional regulator with XRE-family HTH domain
LKSQNCIKKHRVENKLTQEQLAEKTNLTLRAFQSYERGERTPDAHTILRIAKALNTTVEKLYQ